MASRTSFARTALPRYSGSPADHQPPQEDGDHGRHEHADQAGAEAAIGHFPQQHVEQEHAAAQGAEGTGLRGAGTAGAVGGGDPRQDRLGQTEADLLALEIRTGSDGRRQGRRPGRFGQVQPTQAEGEQQRHDREQHPSRVPPPGHAPEGVGQTGRNDHDGEHAQEVGQGGGIGEGVGPVRSEKAAAIGAQVLDGFQGRRGPQRQHLAPPAQRGQGQVVPEAQDGSLPHQRQPTICTACRSVVSPE